VPPAPGFALAFPLLRLRLAPRARLQRDDLTRPLVIVGYVAGVPCAAIAWHDAAVRERRKARTGGEGHR
jgi:hypothetical protein